MTDETITPARLRELADRNEIYGGVETTWALSMETAAALRAAADQLVAERETNGAVALLLQQARAAIAAREALLRRARELIGDSADEIEWLLDFARRQAEFEGNVEDGKTGIQTARALAAEIAAALGGTDNGNA